VWRQALSQLARLEAILDRSGEPSRIEARLPSGGRPRQLGVRTLLLGILLAGSNDRPAQLTRVHEALVALEQRDQLRLGVLAPWRNGPHLVTYRQVERTFSLLASCLGPGSDGAPLCRFADALCEASVPTEYSGVSTAYAVDWTDYATWARPVGKDAVGISADPDASWGHRKSHAPGEPDCLFFGYYLQAAVMVAEEGDAPCPELIRRITLDPCNVDPPTAMAAALRSMVDDGVGVGDVLADSGYAYREPSRWAAPLRALGARLVQDLHPHDRGPKGTFEGAVLANGSLFCPAIPAALLGLGPLHRSATKAQIDDHDAKTIELSRFRLGPICAEDADGYQRVACPAAAGKIRCPLKPASLALGFEHPEVLSPPVGLAPKCCAQQTITVPASVNLKTRQKHPYPSVIWRRSYSRRTAAERAFSTLKDPSSTDVRRGSSRLMGRTKNLIMLTGAVVVRNIRILDSFMRSKRQDERRLARGLPPRTRTRRRRVLSELVGSPDLPQPAVIDTR
jgi:hypothetical protein